MSAAASISTCGASAGSPISSENAVPPSASPTTKISLTPVPVRGLARGIEEREDRERKLAPESSS